MNTLQAIKTALGPLPFFQDEDDVEKGKDEKDKSKTKDNIDAATPIPAQQASHRPAVLADGSYASQTAITDTVTTSSLSSTAPNIRSVLPSGAALPQSCCIIPVVLHYPVVLHDPVVLYYPNGAALPQLCCITPAVLYYPSGAALPQQCCVPPVVLHCPSGAVPPQTCCITPEVLHYPGGAVLFQSCCITPVEHHTKCAPCMASQANMLFGCSFASANSIYIYIASKLSRIESKWVPLVVHNVSCSTALVSAKTIKSST